MDYQPPSTVQLPDSLPAQCFVAAAEDYQVPAMVLVAIAKTESNGRSVVSKNNDGSYDYGVMQHNTNSWVPYFEREFGISRERLVKEPCQSIRAAAYVLRKEQDHKSCEGRPIWCGVGRYHAPNNLGLAQEYVGRVWKSLQKIVREGKF